MALRPYYLGDTSALARFGRPEVAVRLAPLLESGLVARCTPTDLEAGFVSPGPAKHRAMREARSAWPFVSMDQPVLDRAVAVQDALAERSQQRGVKIADLLIDPRQRPLVLWSCTTTTTSTSSPTSRAKGASGSFHRGPSLERFQVLA